jgi:SAM-dependent methyltransferase
MQKTIKKLLKAIIPTDQRAELKKIIKQIHNYGFKFKCPICGSKLRKFLPFGFDFPVLVEKNVVGGGYRLNAKCPVCGSMDRERLLYLYLSKKTDIFTKRIKLLHIAPEMVLSSILKKQTNIDYITADLYSNKVLFRMDLTDIPYADALFDAVICNHVLEHIVNDRKAMIELYRILKPGGMGILQVPISLSMEKTYEDRTKSKPQEREQEFGQADHVRIYGRDYFNRLEETGFQVNQFHWWKDCREFGGAMNRYGLIKNESVISVIKPQ